MNFEQWLNNAQKNLKTAGIATNHLDSLILLSHVTRLDHASIIAHPENVISPEQTNRLNGLLSQRMSRQPISYILGKKEFYGREFIVNKNVLIPRPESESFIDLLKKHNITHQNIIDVGCGSGILGITTELELPTNQVTLCDIDKKALEVAKQNVKNLSSNCKFIKNNLLPIDNNYSVVLANLPYVPRNLKTKPELNFEPAIALYADNSGMALYNQLWKQISQQQTIKFMLTESMLSQHLSMAKLATKYNFSLMDTLGLVQLFTK